MVIYWLKHQGTRFPIHRGRCVLGRSPQCFVVLGGRRVSREHAEVRVVRGQLQISDLGSRNGTLVNGQTIDGPRALFSGDIVEVGDERLEVLHPDDTELPATLRVSDADVEPAALAHRNVLELIEELMMRAVETSQRATIAQTIQSMIDALLESIERSGRRLGPGESVRLAAVAQIVVDWLEDSDRLDWHQQVAQTLAV